MFEKINLVDQSIIVEKIPKILPINFDKLNLNVFNNFYYQNAQNNNESSYLKNYYHVDHDIEITWLSDFIRDHYCVKFEKTPVLLASAGILVEQNQSINYHHHLDEYDLENSPDISVIVTLKTGKEPSFIEFQYEQGRKRHQHHRVQLKEKQLIIFNSELRHCFTKNFNSRPTVNLSLKYQLI